MKKTTILLGVFFLLLTISLAWAVVEHNAVLSLERDVRERDGEISERDMATVDRDTVITWLDTALHLAESRINLKLPNASRYLETLSDLIGVEKVTKVFLNSTAAGYHYLPTTEFTTDLFKVRGSINSSRGILELTQNRSIVLSRWGWMFDSGGLGEGMYEYGIWSGDPVFIIGATIRNDYTSADLGIAVGNRTGNYLSSINLGVRLYGQNGSIIQAPIIKNATSGSRMATGGIPFLLGIGDTKQVLFYISPSASDIEAIDHYEIYVSDLTPY